MKEIWVHVLYPQPNLPITVLPLQGLNETFLHTFDGALVLPNLFLPDIKGFLTFPRQVVASRSDDLHLRLFFGHNVAVLPDGEDEVNPPEKALQVIPLADLLVVKAQPLTVTHGPLKAIPHLTHGQLIEGWQFGVKSVSEQFHFTVCVLGNGQGVGGNARAAVKNPLADTHCIHSMEITEPGDDAQHPTLGTLGVELNHAFLFVHQQLRIIFQQLIPVLRRQTLDGFRQLLLENPLGINDQNSVLLQPFKHSMYTGAIAMNSFEMLFIHDSRI